MKELRRSWWKSRAAVMALALAALVFAARGARAAGAQLPGDFGLGVVLGEPSGISGKYWLSGTQAVDLCVSVDGAVGFWGDYLWHGWNAFPQPRSGRLAAYLGLGAGIRAYHDAQLNLRAVGGASYFVEDAPVEIFLELVPTFRLTPRGGSSLNAGIGVRYYFKGFN